MANPLISTEKFLQRVLVFFRKNKGRKDKYNLIAGFDNNVFGENNTDLLSLHHEKKLCIIKVKDSQSQIGGG